MSGITSLLLQQGYPQKRRDRGSFPQKVYVYEIDKSLINDYMPQDYAQDPEGETGYFFQSASSSKGSSPDTAFLTVTYGPIDNGGVSSGKREVGSVIQEGTVTVSERPIETHPDYQEGASTQFMDYITNNKIKTYMVASPVYIRSEIINGANTNFSESLLVSGIMAQGAPRGLNGANAANWVKTGRDVRFDGTNLELRDTYSYDARGWKGVDWGLNNT